MTNVAWSLLERTLTVLEELDEYAMAIDHAARTKAEELPPIPDGMTRRITDVLREGRLALAVRAEARP